MNVLGARLNANVRLVGLFLDIKWKFISFGHILDLGVLRTLNMMMYIIVVSVETFHHCKPFNFQINFPYTHQIMLHVLNGHFTSRVHIVLHELCTRTEIEHIRYILSGFYHWILSLD